MKKDGNDEDVALRPAAISPNTRRSVVLLRRVLRLIHCLQQERGASCASCAGKRQSSATANPKWIMAKLERTRSDTNRALEQLLQSMPSKTHSSEASEQQGDALLHHHPARSNLFTIQITVEKLRNMMDAATESPTSGGLAAALDQHERSTAPPSFRRILVSFSTIISAIIYDFIPPRRRKQRKSISSISPMLPRFGRGVTTPITNSRTNNDLNNGIVGGHGESTDNPGLLPVTPPEELQRGHTTILPISLPTTTSSSTPGFVQGLDTVPQTTLLALPRICSHGELTSFQSTTTTSAMGVGVGSSHHRQGSEGYLSGPNFAPDVLVRGTPSSLLSRKESNNISSVSDIRADTKVGTNRPLVETTNKALYDPIMEDISDVYFLDQNSRMLRLLDLMSVFVKLKESTGVERAMITSMLVLNQDEARLFLNDVVLEIENQRRLRDDLVTLPTGLLRNLVVELISLSEQMEQVQNSILNGFSLEALKENYDSDKLWSVMTVYIDKLHSLELLITEEIECCLPASSSGSPPRSPKPTTPNATPRRGLSLEQPLELAPPFMEENLNAEMKECANLWNHTIGTLGTSMDDIQSAIESMSAEDVKRLILTGLRKEDPDGVPIEAVAEDDLDGNVDGTLSSKKGVDDLLKELCNAPATKEWEIDIYELRFLKRIGQGSAGTTYIAEWSGLTVAVKVASINEMGLEGWRTEVQALQKLHHPNIIRLLGSVYHPQPLTFCLVLEYCDAGDLASALLKVTPRNFFFLVSVSIAKGLTYLHNRGIIHRGRTIIRSMISVLYFCLSHMARSVLHQISNLQTYCYTETLLPGICK